MSYGEEKQHRCCIVATIARFARYCGAPCVRSVLKRTRLEVEPNGVVCSGINDAPHHYVSWVENYYIPGTTYSFFGV